MIAAKRTEYSMNAILNDLGLKPWLLCYLYTKCTKSIKTKITSKMLKEIGTLIYLKQLFQAKMEKLEKVNLRH